MTHDAQIAFVGGREVRIFPKGWQHPRNDRGRFTPLLSTDYVFDDEEHETGAAAKMPDASGLPTHGTEIAAYEAVSEGTPISPAFPNTPEGKLALVNYCAEYHRADAEAWAAILFGDAAIALDATVVANDG